MGVKELRLSMLERKMEFTKRRFQEARETDKDYTHMNQFELRIKELNERYYKLCGNYYTIKLD